MISVFNDHQPHLWCNGRGACLEYGRPCVRSGQTKAKTDWLRIRIMCWSGTTCLVADCCFSEPALYKFS